MIILSILLFFVLTPGILVTLPKKASKYVVAFTHAVIFAFVYHLFARWFWHSKMANRKSEGFSEGVGEDEGAWKNMRDWIDKHVDSDATGDEISDIKTNLKTKLDNMEKTKSDIIDWIQNHSKLKPAGDIDRMKNLITEYRDNKSS